MKIDEQTSVQKMQRQRFVLFALCREKRDDDY